LETLQASIKRQSDVDYVHALLNCCLKIHYDLIVNDSELIALLREIKNVSS